MVGGSSKRVRKDTKAKKTIDQYFGIVEPKNKSTFLFYSLRSKRGILDIQWFRIV